MSEVTIVRPSGASFSFDVLRRASLGRSLIIPEHAIDPGIAGTVSVTTVDTVTLGPFDMSLDVLVSGTPSPDIGTSQTREQDALDFLEAIVGELVTVVLPKFRAVTNCLLMSSPYEITTSRATPLTLMFRKQEIPERGTVVLARVAPRARNDLPKEEDGGDAATTPVPPAKQPPRESILVSIGKRF